MLIAILIPYTIFSQTISIELEKEQWEEIKYGLEKGQKDKEKVHMLEEALKLSDSVRSDDEEVILAYDKENKTLKNQLSLKDVQIENLKQQRDLNKEKYKTGRQKRFGVSPIIGIGFGTDSTNPQIIGGLGITYRLLKL